MENFAQVLKIFIEKHLIPSVISVAGAIITLLLLPEDNYIIQKLGKLLFIILAFCIYFLLVQGLLITGNGIRKAIKYIQQRNVETQQQKEENQNAIEETHRFFDRLDQEAKDLLLGFIKNGNKILLDFPMNYEFLLLQIMNVSDFEGDLKNIDKKHYWLTNRLNAVVLETIADDDNEIFGLKQYKIQDEIFHQLEYIYKKDGKLGHF